jgi:predicted alternative tryptophan synthase beta-subunit
VLIDHLPPKWRNVSADSPQKKQQDQNQCRREAYAANELGDVFHEIVFFF